MRSIVLLVVTATAQYYNYSDAFQNLEDHLQFLDCPLEDRAPGFPREVDLDFFLNMRHTASFDLPSQTVLLQHPFDMHPGLVHFRITNGTVTVRNRAIHTKAHRSFQEHGQLLRTVYLAKPPLVRSDQRFSFAGSLPVITLVPFSDGTIKPTTDSASIDMVRRNDLSTYQQSEIFSNRVVGLYTNSHYEMGYDRATRKVYSFVSGILGTFVLAQPLDRSLPRLPIAWFANRNTVGHQVLQTENWIIVPSVLLRLDDTFKIITSQLLELRGSPGRAPWFLVSKRHPHRRIRVQGPPNSYAQHWSNCFEIDEGHIQCSTPEGTCAGAPPWDLGQLIAGDATVRSRICPWDCVIDLHHKIVDCNENVPKTSIALPTVDPRVRGSTTTVEWGTSDFFTRTSEVESHVLRRTINSIIQTTDTDVIFDEVKMVPTGAKEGEGVVMAIGTSKTDPSAHWLCVFDATSLAALGRYKIPFELNVYIHGIVVDRKGDFW